MDESIYLVCVDLPLYTSKTMKKEKYLACIISNGTFGFVIFTVYEISYGYPVLLIILADGRTFFQDFNYWVLLLCQPGTQMYLLVMPVIGLHCHAVEPCDGSGSGMC